MKTLSFSKTYNLFKLREVLGSVKECLLKLGISKMNTTSLNKSVIVYASRKNVSIVITVSEGTIVDNSLRYLRGQSNVKIEVAVSSQDDNNLTELIEEFKKCLLIRVSRGGG